jgi:hypothetical protein
VLLIVFRQRSFFPSQLRIHLAEALTYRIDTARQLRAA